MRETPPSVNGFWENKSFHNYADYAMGVPFAKAWRDLLNLGTTAARSCALKPCGGVAIDDNR